jgi:UDP-glucose 4-epimerase
MKALITGGAGFIGSNLAEGLRSRGIHVRVLDDLSSGYRQNLDGLDVEFVEGDVRHRETVDAAVRDYGLVFHLAASVGDKRSIDDPVRDSEVKFLGTEPLRSFAACRRTQGRRVVIRRHLRRD